MAEFAKKKDFKGCTVHPLSDVDRFSFLIIVIEASTESNRVQLVLMYGHMSKQPFIESWKYQPTDPVFEKWEKFLPWIHR